MRYLEAMLYELITGLGIAMCAFGIGIMVGRRAAVRRAKKELMDELPSVWNVKKPS